MKEQVPGIRCQVPGNGHPGKFPYGLGGSARIGDQTRNVYENKEEQALGLRCHVAGEKAGVRSLHNAAIGTIILASDFQLLISASKNAGASGDMYENKGEGKIGARCQATAPRATAPGSGSQLHSEEAGCMLPPAKGKRIGARHPEE